MDVKRLSRLLAVICRRIAAIAAATSGLSRRCVGTRVEIRVPIGPMAHRGDAFADVAKEPVHRLPPE